jgi:hypothetical protein
MKDDLVEEEVMYAVWEASYLSPAAATSEMERKRKEYKGTNEIAGPWRIYRPSSWHGTKEPIHIHCIPLSWGENTICECRARECKR